MVATSMELCVRLQVFKQPDSLFLKRRGSKRAALAVGHDILVIYSQMMTTGQE